MGHEKSRGAKIVERLKSFAETLENNETISERFTCRTIKVDLQPQQYSPEAVKETRNLLHASQAIFANFFGVSVKTVHDWEQGRTPPQGTACRLMDEIRRDPQYWLKRLKELATTGDDSMESVTQ
ncbi:helix-turn-helix domain-containing protein [Blastopirellula marina]|uniref:Transcriptional regulator n=1 Tax=Blastopirellula marina TaxID=124 RepID=A0A2S8GC98_9BACT|nr:transcriptional regulator [Blastopirellula marina]PQO42043.1 transcriptional regulator [Blastopirellula marina]